MTSEELREPELVRVAQHEVGEIRVRERVVIGGGVASGRDRELPEALGLAEYPARTGVGLIGELFERHAQRQPRALLREESGE